MQLHTSHQCGMFEVQKHPSTANHPHIVHRSHRRYCPFAFTQQKTMLLSSKLTEWTQWHETYSTNPFWLPVLDLALTVHSPFRPPPDTDITLVTQFSLGRLHNLQVQCAVWPGSLAAVLYIPVIQGTDEVMLPPNATGLLAGLNTTSLAAVLDRVHHIAQALVLSADGRATQRDAPITEGPGSSTPPPPQCALHLRVYVEHLPRPETYPASTGGAAWASYPVNALRNRAIAMATTKATLVVDGDFIPGPAPRLLQLLRDRTQYNTLVTFMQSRRAVFVLPALEANINQPLDAQHATMLQAVFASGKPALRDMVQTGHVSEFQPLYHAQTNFSRWLTTTTKAYRVAYDGKNGHPGQYEPDFFVLKQHMPAYDERFRGYFFDKVSQVYTLASAGTQFFVMPDAYVLHAPHARDMQNKSWDAFAGVKQYILQHVIGRDIKSGQGFVPMVADVGVCGQVKREGGMVGGATFHPRL